jgi:hypothetical protein
MEREMATPSEAGGGPMPDGPEPGTGAEPDMGTEPRTGAEPSTSAEPSASAERRTGPAPGSPEETLRRLEQRLDQASEAAERLMAQVAAEAARAGAPATAGDATGTGNQAADEATPDGDADGSSQTPPAGWQTPEDEPPRVAPELDPLLALLHTMRDLIPPELQQRLISALREVLLALRALIDWYLERMDRRREQGVEVQDIPIL